MTDGVNKRAPTSRKRLRVFLAVLLGLLVFWLFVPLLGGSFRGEPLAENWFAVLVTPTDTGGWECGLWMEGAGNYNPPDAMFDAVADLEPGGYVIPFGEQVRKFPGPVPGDESAIAHWSASWILPTGTTETLFVNANDQPPISFPPEAEVAEFVEKQILPYRSYPMCEIFPSPTRTSGVRLWWGTYKDLSRPWLQIVFWGAVVAGCGLVGAFVSLIFVPPIPKVEVEKSLTIESGPGV